MALVDPVDLISGIAEADTRNFRIYWVAVDEAGGVVGSGTWSVSSISHTENAIVIRTNTVNTPSTGAKLRVYVQIYFSYGGWHNALYLGEFELGKEIPAGDVGTLEFIITSAVTSGQAQA